MQTLLSEHWHAVRFLRPRLREGVQPLHRLLRGKPWVLLLDPVTQRFHRMTPQVWRVLQLLDGRRTLDEVWNAACEKAAASGTNGTAHDDTISQHELVQLMSSLYSNDLLQTQVSPDADEVFERYQRQQRAKFKQSWLNPMSVKVPLLYPDAWFERRAWLARLLFSWPVLLIWLALVTPAGVLAWQHWAALTDNISDRVLSGSNVVLLWFTYPLVKAVHEWAHGMAVKAWGGQVREIGVMFILFTPVPYVDATSSYRFPSKWARAAVAAAGILAELMLGALAVYVWLMAESGLVTAIAFNVILIAGVSTVLVNGNPLMRYDGYFIACDLLELPNLAQRATQYWAYLFDRYAFGARDAQPPVEARGERAIMFVYGAVSPVYRLLVSIGLIWFVASEYLFAGILMGLMSAWSALVMPVWKGWKHLTEGAGLARRREVAMRRTVIALVVVAAFVGLVPLPFHSIEQGVVWLPDEAIVRAEVAGHVAHTERTSGDTVARNALLLRLDSLQLSADAGTAAAAVAQTQAQLRKAEVDDVLRAASLRHELAARQARFDEAVRRADALEVKAGSAGRWTPAAPTELPGRYVKRGEVLGYVINGPSRLIRVAVGQEDRDLIGSRLRGVEVRLNNSPEEIIGARVRRLVPGGELDLVSPALGTSGGGQIAVDPSQQGGTRTLKRVFDIEVELDRNSPSAVFGDRAYVRFDLGSTPLAWQWFLRLRQVFLAQLSV
jgi:putative peptide zinc metalloprotease protein